MKRLLWMIPLFLFYALVIAQSTALRTQEILFPGVYGEALLDSLRKYYAPDTVWSYSDARDYMFTVLDNENDSVTCVYTGYRIYLDHNSTTPRSDAYNAGINTEHTWPQSKGAYGNAKSDLHHLFPTRIEVNADRGSLPFDDIPDDLTNRWYRLDQVLYTKPTSHIDEYSELEIDERFEPREDHKGNVARAMFYFYTMYKSQADGEDPNFFAIQKATLWRWNSQDTVDSRERRRSALIAAIQGNENPFVLDTTLAGRAYFGVTAISQTPSYTPDRFRLESNFPNPFNGSTVIRYYLPRGSGITLAVYNIVGQRVATLVSGYQEAGWHRVQWQARTDTGRPVPGGIYFVVLTAPDVRLVRKMIYLP